MKKGTKTAVAVSVRPPVVAVLGHVDHGKTTLLDFIRKTTVASHEHGGITQHIGAYQIDHKTKDGHMRPITFIDTPGHEAFGKIRSRGAKAADIAILVVAANDSVKPQTIESIRQIKDAGIPLIVAINKIDLEGVIIDKVKSDLAKAGIQVEGFGGDVPVALVSAKTGKGVPELLELVLLVTDMQPIPPDTGTDIRSVVIEAKVDKHKGMVATLLVKNGTLVVNVPLFEHEVQVGKVRAMMDENGKRIDAAGPGKPVEVLGFSILPSVGSLITNTAAAADVKPAAVAAKSANVAEFLAAMTAAEKKRLKLVIKADTSGSLEAVVGSLPASDIDIVRCSLGEITDNDILEAQATGSVVVGFNVKVTPSAEKVAIHEKVIYRTYSIIYELLDEMADVVTGMEDLLKRERELGQGEIIAEFPFDHERIAGTKVTKGRLAKGDLVRVMRDGEMVGEARIKSIRLGKNETTKVEIGTECGIHFDKKLDFLLKDSIIAYTTG